MARHIKTLKLGTRFSILAGLLLCISTALIIVFCGAVFRAQFMDCLLYTSDAADEL